MKESMELPVQVELSPAYPNPFNPSTTINISLPENMNVSLAVYDIQGRLVEQLITNEIEAGHHSIIWDGYSQASGIYFLKLIAGETVQSQKLMLVK